MALIFISKQHEETFIYSLKKAKASTGNRPLQVALYVLTALPNLKDRLEILVNFQGGYLNPDGVNHANFSQGEKIMIRLANNLFNGVEMLGVPTSPFNQMANVDKEMKRVYLSALEYRFF
ncbi:DUF6075 family protein [Brevibacillus sp. NPDC058079]|uniref:DUF6075 family protein n=1 Tax=Brevibacillus sp. NPDC058079 TaxID=3346330 RepID=UPI0036E0EBB8